MVSVVLNGTLLADAQLLHREVSRGNATNSRVWFPEREAMDWRMDFATRERRTIEGVPHAVFCDQRDRCFYDESVALLTITLNNDDILPLRFTQAWAQVDVQAVQSTGAYLNYDLSAFYVGQPGAAAFLEGRTYTPYGHGAVRLGGVVGAVGSYRTVMQAVWQVDLPQQALSWQIGSIAIPDTPLGVGLALTGMRIGSNLRLQPLRSNALKPRMDGLAERSLRTDMFVDGLFRQTAEVPYGPYSMEMQPQYPGRGEMHLVSTDITGLQISRSLSYYNAPQMLTPGATEWSVDAGVLSSEVQRINLHQPAVASATVRRGMTTELTAQSQLVIARRAERVALSIDTVQSLRGLSSLSMVWQRSDAETSGRLWLGAAHEYLARDISFSVKAEQSLGACRSDTIADPLVERLWRPCRLLSTGLGFSLGGRWSVALSTEVRQDTVNRHTSIAGVGARLQVGTRSQLGLSLQRLAIDGQVASGIYLSWSQPFGGAYEVQVGFQQRAGEHGSLQWSAQSAVSPDLQASAQKFQTYGSVGQRNEAGVRTSARMAQLEWRADAKVDQRGVSGAVGVSGAIGVAEGRVFASRRIDDAFIIVDVGIPDLPVLLDNREVARTNASGWAIVTEGRAHQANSVGVDTSALPIEYSMPRDQQMVVPASKAGALARFDISDGGVAIPVRDAQGNTLPAGVSVRVSTQRLPTAITSRSEVFLERSDRPAEITVEWADQRCQFSYNPQNEPQGGYRCTKP